MKTKLVLWGQKDDDKVMLGMDLRPDDNKVDIWIFPESIVDEAFSQKMMNEWRNGAEDVPFPEGVAHIERDLSLSDSLLPDDILVDRTDLVQRAQTEWHFVVLSAKMHQAYQSELDDIRDRVEKIEKYDLNLWDNLKDFWDKVHGQVRERNLFREHADSLKEGINELFAKLKELRAVVDNEFAKVSKDNYDKFNDALNGIESRLNDGGRIAGLFDELKDMQRKFRDTKLTKENRNELWTRIDGLFKKVKEKRFGKQAGNEGNSSTDRLNHRYEGLLKAIEKMERSIDRDKRDLEFESKRARETDGQLEAQIRQAKIKMIESRVESKEEKLAEMRATMTELDKRMKAQQERDRKKQERNRIEEAKKVVEAKIEAEIKDAADARSEVADKLEKAAELINPNEETKDLASSFAAAPALEKAVEAAEEAAPETSLSEKAEDALEDVVDTAKAIGLVISDKVDDMFEEFSDLGDVDIDDEIGIDAPDDDEAGDNKEGGNA
jgi:uncharacterized coiled-coil DUF342 family protein